MKTKIITILMGLFLWATVVQADIIWNGSVSGDVTDTANWDGGVLPTAIDIAIVTNTANDPASGTCDASNVICCGSVVWRATAASDATFYNTSYNSLTVSGNGTFYDSTINYSTVSGNGTFSGSSYNNSTVGGDGVFSDTSYNSGTVLGNGTFYDNTFNDDIVSSNGVFYGSSYNYGQVLGDGTFYGASSNLDVVAGTGLFYSVQAVVTNFVGVGFCGTVVIPSNVTFVTDAYDWTFDASTWNFLETALWVFTNAATFNGTCSNAVFFDTSYNNAGTVLGNAIFFNTSSNRGTVVGNALFDPNPTVVTNFTSGTCGSITFSPAVTFVVDGANAWTTNVFGAVSSIGPLILLHFNGTDGSTNFVENGHNPNPWLNATTDLLYLTNDAPKFGTASLYGEGVAGSRIVSANSTAVFANSNWTFDCWVKTPSLPHTEYSILDKGDAGSYSPLLFRVQVDNTLSLLCSRDGISWGSDDAITTALPLPENEWVHVALVNTIDTRIIYTNGIWAGAAPAPTAPLWDNTEDWCIGTMNYFPGTELLGGIDEYRFIVGEATWITDFIPPVAEYASASIVTNAGWTFNNGASWVFNDTAQNVGIISNSTFNDDSINAGHVIGNSTFYSNSINHSTVSGNGTFYNASYNSGTVSGNGAFYNDSFNDDTVSGNAIFNRTSYNSGTVLLNATFDGSSSNQISGTVNGTATWKGNAVNWSGVTGSSMGRHGSGINGTEILGMQ